MRKDSDLVIVAAGKGAVSQLFERDAARSMYDKPMRALALAYAKGVKPYDKTCVTATLIPGAGELFMIPALTMRDRAKSCSLKADRVAPSIHSMARLMRTRSSPRSRP